MKNKTAKTTKKGIAGNTKKSRSSVKVAAEIVVPRAERAGKRAASAKGRASSVKKGGVRRWAIGLAAAVLLIAGGATAAVCLWNHEAPTGEVSQEPPVEAEPEPELEPEPEGPAEGDEPLVPEPEIADWSAYTVAPNKPRYLTIAEIGLENVPIIEVGLTSGGAMGAPASSYIVGWYYRSAYPGRVGKWATVIDGHGGPLGDGVFKWLPNLVPGNEIVIEMGDGRKFTYAVTEMVYKDKGAEADAYMKVGDRPVDAETPTLTLITCTGDWIRAEQTYTQRLFVRAVLKE